ncbi:MAG: T9SS type A sorting domain-containing protein [Bacteroidetes bacterium]|nr:T9SS type A sorting domain-containing protein [Bacteroidota bacterium]
MTFTYTPDYGKSWHFNCSFPYRARGFAAADTNDIWMTVLRQPNEYYTWANTRIYTTNYDAYWIVHSTDRGQTWSIDSTTLWDSDLGESDGAIISSSDRNHVWIAAERGAHTYIFRYEGEQPHSGVEEYVPLNYPKFVNVFPNPATEHTQIALARNCPITTLRLVDIMGREQSVPIKRLTEYSVDVDVSKLPSGIYLAGITTPYGPYTNMVVVER